MKKRYIIEESEKNEILSMHKALMKEQVQTTGPVTPVLNTGEETLRKAKAAGCLINGQLFTNPDKTKFVYRATTKSGKEIDFYGDMTYKFKDGSKSGNWKCDKIAQQDTQQAKTTQSAADAQNKKQQYIDKFTGKTYNYVFNVPDIDKQNYTELDPVNDLKVPAGVFAVTDKFYSNPSVNKDIKGRSDSTLDDVLENQSINRNACRKNIEDYYKSFKRKNSIVIDGPTFDKAKRIVQSCKDEHYGKWGVLGGGNNYDKILDTMSGGSGGPLSYGEDAKWRLK
jgi:hypothetical protein